jgi:prevent-host-death family protein
MQINNIHETKTQLSRLLEKVMKGEEIIIAKAGKPVAKLVPYTEKPTKRQPGFWKGKVTMSEDFDQTPDSVIKFFHGETE